MKRATLAFPSHDVVTVANFIRYVMIKSMSQNVTFLVLKSFTYNMAKDIAPWKSCLGLKNL